MNDYLADLERKHQEEVSNVRELQDFWCQCFPKCEYIPADKRFFWWVRTYDMRLLRYAVSIAAMNLSHSLTPDRLGKYVSAVARNIREQGGAA
jgi:hypothetical protein